MSEKTPFARVVPKIRDTSKESTVDATSARDRNDTSTYTSKSSKKDFISRNKNVKTMRSLREDFSAKR